MRSFLFISHNYHLYRLVFVQGGRAAAWVVAIGAVVSVLFHVIRVSYEMNFSVMNMCISLSQMVTLQILFHSCLNDIGQKWNDCHKC